MKFFYGIPFIAAIDIKVKSKEEFERRFQEFSSLFDEHKLKETFKVRILNEDNEELIHLDYSVVQRLKAHALIKKQGLGKDDIKSRIASLGEKFSVDLSRLSEVHYLTALLGSGDIEHVNLYGTQVGTEEVFLLFAEHPNPEELTVTMPSGRLWNIDHVLISRSFDKKIPEEDFSVDTEDQDEDREISRYADIASLYLLLDNYGINRERLFVTEDRVELDLSPLIMGNVVENILPDKIYEILNVIKNVTLITHLIIDGENIAYDDAFEILVNFLEVLEIRNNDILIEQCEAKVTTGLVSTVSVVGDYITVGEAGSKARIEQFRVDADKAIDEIKNEIEGNQGFACSVAVAKYPRENELIIRARKNRLPDLAFLAKYPLITRIKIIPDIDSDVLSLHNLPHLENISALDLSKVRTRSLEGVEKLENLREILINDEMVPDYKSLINLEFLRRITFITKESPKVAKNAFYSDAIVDFYANSLSRHRVEIINAYSGYDSFRVINSKKTDLWNISAVYEYTLSSTQMEYRSKNYEKMLIENILREFDLPVELLKDNGISLTLDLSKQKKGDIKDLLERLKKYIYVSDINLANAQVDNIDIKMLLLNITGLKRVKVSGALDRLLLEDNNFMQYLVSDSKQDLFDEKVYNVGLYMDLNYTYEDVDDAFGKHIILLLRNLQREFGITVNMDFMLTDYVENGVRRMAIKLFTDRVKPKDLEGYFLNLSQVGSLPFEFHKTENRNLVENLQPYYQDTAISFITVAESVTNEDILSLLMINPNRQNLRIKRGEKIYRYSDVPVRYLSAEAQKKTLEDIFQDRIEIAIHPNGLNVVVKVWDQDDLSLIPLLVQASRINLLVIDNKIPIAINSLKELRQLQELSVFGDIKDPENLLNLRSLVSLIVPSIPLKVLRKINKLKYLRSLRLMQPPKNNDILKTLFYIFYQMPLKEYFELVINSESFNVNNISKLLGLSVPKKQKKQRKGLDEAEIVLFTTLNSFRDLYKDSKDEWAEVLGNTFRRAINSGWGKDFYAKLKIAYELGIVDKQLLGIIISHQIEPVEEEDQSILIDIAA